MKIPVFRTLECSPVRCFIRMTKYPVPAVNRHIIVVINFDKKIDNTKNPNSVAATVTAAIIRKRPRIPKNSNGFCKPLKT